MRLFTSYQFPPFLQSAASDACKCKHFKSLSTVRHGKENNNSIARRQPTMGGSIDWQGQSKAQRPIPPLPHVTPEAGVLSFNVWLQCVGSAHSRSSIITYIYCTLYTTHTGPSNIDFRTSSEHHQNNPHAIFYITCTRSLTNHNFCSSLERSYFLLRSARRRSPAVLGCGCCAFDYPCQSMLPPIIRCRHAMLLLFSLPCRSESTTCFQVF